MYIFIDSFYIICVEEPTVPPTVARRATAVPPPFLIGVLIGVLIGILIGVLIGVLDLLS